MRRFTIYTQEEAFPLVEIQFKHKEVVAAVKAGKFPVEQVGPAFKKALEGIQAAIREGQTNDGKKED
jgi:hypothetical protein